MKVLITAGATQTPIDQVRAITNIFRGRTGAQIAEWISDAGHDVTLLTSAPKSEHPSSALCPIQIHTFRTYDELAQLMEQEIRTGGYDLVIHSAAVSDYKVVATHILCEPGEASYMGPARLVIKLLQLVTGKISSSHKRLFLELFPTEKLIDKIRRDWGFKGFLVKFKLQVDKTDEELIDIARKSREDSNADLIVANCKEWAHQRAYVIGRDSYAFNVPRNIIAGAILLRMR